MVLPILTTEKPICPPYRLFLHKTNTGVDIVGKIAYQFKEYIVIEDDYRSGWHVIINTLGKYKSHGHVKHLGTCKKFLKLIDKGIVPDSPYLRGTALRVSLDEKYIEKVKHKIDKDKNKQNYFNPNKGVVRK